ncbi:MAG: hypothetical protein GYB66_03605, partial [Chloroflexi bacterium]|nr:hypothetical protein [Chloroflexota bacterium]
MSIPKLVTFGSALLALAVVAGIGLLILQPPQDLITHAGFSDNTISPNADGVNDIAVFEYGLSRPATITLTFTSEDQQVYEFRGNARRSPRDYSVNFSGVVDGFSLPTDPTGAGTIERRLLPDGRYTWTLEARDDDDEVETRTGTLTIEDADISMPWITAFDLSADRFTPNQDGVRDRVAVNVYLNKPADLKVFLENEQGARIFLSERLLGREPGEEGNHEYDYDGGVDDGYEPPPDGEYKLFAIAQDNVGQRVVQQETLTIVGGGLPQVEIAPQNVGATVCFSTLPWDDRYYTDGEVQGDPVEMPEGSCSELTTLTLEEGDLLVFKLSVWNFGDTRVRTMGPFAGTVYQFDQLASTLGYLPSDGTFRIGITCETAIDQYPWRWALGTPADLTKVEDRELNDTFYYLEPGDRAVVWGAIR